MNKPILAITLITLIFLSCSKSENDSPSTPDTTLYEGTWRGNLIPVSGGAVPTTWIMKVTGDGIVRQTHDNVHGPGTGFGSITEDGILKLRYDGGATETGRFNAELGIYRGSASHGINMAESFGTKD